MWPVTDIRKIHEKYNHSPRFRHKSKTHNYRRVPHYTPRAAAAMDHIQAIVDPSKQFMKDSLRLVKRCTKPDRKEYQKIALATAVGFAIMGFIGFFVKLIHIPINNIIVGG